MEHDLKSDPWSEPAGKTSRRYPRVIDDGEIASVPTWSLAEGVETTVFLSRELDDARYFRQGIYHLASDHPYFDWPQTNYDEAQYCVKGLLRLRCTDSDGKSVVLEAAAGEHIYLPAGFRYGFESTGVDTRVLWTSGPSPRPGIQVARGEAFVGAKEYGIALLTARGDL